MTKRKKDRREIIVKGVGGLPVSRKKCEIRCRTGDVTGVDVLGWIVWEDIIRTKAGQGVLSVCQRENEEAMHL